MTEEEIKKDVPRMLYHVVEAPVIAYNVKELQSYLDHGWSLHPLDFSEEEAIRAKIKYHQAEAESLADKLIILEDLRKNENKLEEKEPIVGPADSMDRPHKAGRKKGK